MNQNESQSVIAAQMQRVDGCIRTCLRSEVVLINQLSEYIIAAGGKRLRPRLVLLAAHAAGYRGEAHIEAAAVIEFIHTATLLHDDVVDHSDLRRGRDTANSIWGNEAAVLVGDFLYSRAFEMMVAIGSMPIMSTLAKATNVIAEGEVQQLLNVHNPDVDEAAYFRVIHAKTAALFEAATRTGAILAGQSESCIDALARYGLHLGTAFQLMDDILDFSANPDELGKSIGDDLAEGKPTLPLILAMQRGQDDQRALLREVIISGGREKIASVLTILESTQALAASKLRAQRESERAIEQLTTLPPSPFVDALAELACQALNRRS